MTIQQIKQKIEKLQEQLKILEEQEKTKDFTTIKHKDKEFRLYIWENKPIGDLKVDGFELAKFKDAVELYDEGKLKLDNGKPIYVKHFSKKQQNKEYCLSRLYLDWGLYLGSIDENLADSYSVGRVLMVKVKK